MNADQLWVILAQEGVLDRGQEKPVGKPLEALTNAARRIALLESYNRSLNFTHADAQQMMEAEKAPKVDFTKLHHLARQLNADPSGWAHVPFVGPIYTEGMGYKPTTPVTPPPVPTPGKQEAYTDLLHWDIKPGTIISRDPVNNWFAVLAVMAGRGVLVASCDKWLSFTELHTGGWWMRRDGSWLRCRRITHQGTESTIDTITRFTP